jgi:uncharacterized damage-inducible protein DinB
MIMLSSISTEFQRYKSIAEKAIHQTSVEELNRIPHPDGNSIGMLVRHISGNLKSRFTDFLTTDGEKSWRQRDQEFEERNYNIDEINALWDEGWNVLEDTLNSLNESDLNRTVTIRQQPLSVEEALARSLAHISYHTGQIVLLARLSKGKDWQWISIPKGNSEKYNQNPTKEKSPRQS